MATPNADSGPTVESPLMRQSDQVAIKGLKSAAGKSFDATAAQAGKVSYSFT